jgi:NSS family neurotransmitter:Na+ symporter
MSTPGNVTIWRARLAAQEEEHAAMSSSIGSRESFATRLGMLASMIGVAVGLGNVWRFPYMVGKFGGAWFVLIYILAVVLLGIPALYAEWTLGFSTRRGPVGAFARAGLPFGRYLGWFFFFVVTAATAYYTNAVGWVLYYAVGEIAGAVGIGWVEAAILPPESGFDLRSLALQMLCTSLVIVGCVLVLLQGVRAGIERVSKVVMPALLVILVILITRALTLPGAWAGVDWYILKLDAGALSPRVALAALGQAFFSLSLGGTFMVVYGSYLGSRAGLARNAVWTATGDLIAGLLAGLAIIPAVFAFGLTPESGPGLIFFTLPKAFAEIPYGWIFGLLFFCGLLGAAFLSDIAAFEVLVAGLTDNTRSRRTSAVWLMAAVVFLLAIPPMINMKVFVPWDLTFGSGMQTLGSLLAVIAVAWLIGRHSTSRETIMAPWLRAWLRFAVPGAILTIGIWWLLSEVLGLFGTG